MFLTVFSNMLYYLPSVSQAGNEKFISRSGRGGLAWSSTWFVQTFGHKLNLFI